MSYAKKIEKLKTDPKYKDLSQIKDRKQVGKNIRIELKKAFPLVKFSVRTDDLSVNIKWIDGVIEHKVNKITDKYKYKYEDKLNPFNDVFGGTDYIFLERDYSDKLIKEAIEKLKKQYEKLVNKNENLKDITVEMFKSGKLLYMPIGEYLSSCMEDSVHAKISGILSDLES